MKKIPYSRWHVFMLVYRNNALDIRWQLKGFERYTNRNIKTYDPYTNTLLARNMLRIRRREERAHTEIAALNHIATIKENDNYKGMHNFLARARAAWEKEEKNEYKYFLIVARSYFREWSENTLTAPSMPLTPREFELARSKMT